ncbi:MAG: TIR domain-containing protein [Chloroflexi bacterium]|jgi:hypothetical protein|nr:MAG: TIR domain-containing protein [Chloroflexota bacterium]
MHDVFLSHSAQDAATAGAIHEAASKMRLDIYLFEHDPRPGENLGDKILREITASRCLLVLLTKNSAASAYVQQEVGAARGQGKLVVPLVEKGLDHSSLATLQGVEYFELDRENPGAVLPELQKASRKQLLADLKIGAALVVVLLILDQW